MGLLYFGKCGQITVSLSKKMCVFLVREQKKKRDSWYTVRMENVYVYVFMYGYE